jgi:hypothetical protein
MYLGCKVKGIVILPARYWKRSVVYGKVKKGAPNNRFEPTWPSVKRHHWRYSHP